jgi:hypothetical protein
MSIDDYLTEEDDSIEVFDDRVPQLGNGVYELHAFKHEWKDSKGEPGLFIAHVDILAAQETSEGLKTFNGQTFEVSKVGEQKAIKIWGFGHKKFHKMAVAKLKAYLGAALRHKGITAKGKHQFIGLAKQLVQAAGGPKAQALFADKSFKCRCEVRPPMSESEDATEWRKYAYPE